MKSQEDKTAYITKRIDRISGSRNGETVQLLAMEDFCQLEGRLTQDKYKGSYERCAKVIDEFSSQRMLDQTELFLRIVFSFAVGNSDMHLKNFSMIETGERSERYVLSAAYDMLPVNVILPEDKEQFALTMNGKKSNLRRRDFLIFAERIGLSDKATEKLISKVVSMEKQYIEMCRNSFIPGTMKDSLEKLISDRVAVLKSY